jgi:hypothetical protein
MNALPVPRPSNRPSAPPDAPFVTIGADGFVPEATLEGWVRTGAATRTGALVVLGDGRRFALRDAVRVVGRRNGDTDPYGFTGRVEALRELLRRGAMLSSDGLRLGQAIYDVEFGAIATPA